MPLKLFYLKFPLQSFYFILQLLRRSDTHCSTQMSISPSHPLLTTNINIFSIFDNNNNKHSVVFSSSYNTDLRFHQKFQKIKMNSRRDLFQQRYFRGNNEDFIEVGLQAKIVNGEFKFETVVYVIFNKFGYSKIKVKSKDLHHFFDVLLQTLPLRYFKLHSEEPQNPYGLATIEYKKRDRTKTMMTNNTAINNFIDEHTSIRRICDCLDFMKVSMEIQVKILKEYMKNHNILSLNDLIRDGNNHYNDKINGPICVDLNQIACELFEEYLNIERESER